MTTYYPASDINNQEGRYSETSARPNVGHSDAQDRLLSESPLWGFLKFAHYTGRGQGEICATECLVFIDHAWKKMYL